MKNIVAKMTLSPTARKIICIATEVLANLDFINTIIHKVFKTRPTGVAASSAHMTAYSNK